MSAARSLDRVYLTHDLPRHLIAPLTERYDLRVWEGPGPVPREVLAEALREVDGLLCMLTDTIDGELLDLAPRLRVVSQMAVGVDNIGIDECARRGIPVGHTPDVLTDTVADHAFALLGAIVRRIPEAEREVRSGQWGDWEPFHLTGGDLHGSTLGIVGLGRIGSAVARRGEGFDMQVLYTSRRPGGDPSWGHVDLSRLLAESDHVVITVGLTAETRGMIGSDQLRAMKESAYLVNVARGPIVETEALVEALRERWIAGAALDVTDPEPLPADHPLVSLDNCLVVPHIGSASIRTREAMARLAVDNLVAGLEGRPLPARYPV